MVKTRSLRYANVRGCPYCGKAMDPALVNHPKSGTNDHVLPKSRGGHWQVRVCLRCNGHKADNTIHEWLQILREKDDPRVAWVEQFIKKWSREIAICDARDTGRREIVVEEEDA